MWFLQEEAFTGLKTECFLLLLHWSLDGWKEKLDSCLSEDPVHNTDIYRERARAGPVCVLACHQARSSSQQRKRANPGSTNGHSAAFGESVTWVVRQAVLPSCERKVGKASSSNDDSSAPAPLGVTLSFTSYSRLQNESDRWLV